MSLLLILSLVFVGVQLLTLLGNLIFFPVLSAADSDTGPAERVSLLVPARNEARTLPETLPRLLEQGALEVLVLDDESTDDTAAVLAGFSGGALRTIGGRPLPEGWSGKNWACHQLAEAARGEILIFTDADVYWEEGTLRSLLAFRQREGAEFVSVWPRQRTLSLAERVAVPAIDLVLLGALPYLGVKYLPLPALAAGNGQLMLFTRDAYKRLGGHAAFRGEVLEDVRMGQGAKARGLSVALALGGERLSTRMYDSPEAILEGFGKNILAAVGGSRLLLVLLGLLNTLSYTLAWLLGFYDPRWFLVGALGLLQRALTCVKTRRTPLEAPLQALLVFPFWRVTLRALRRGGAYRWKGRDYA